MQGDYSLASHGRMLADRIRVDAYLEALRRTVTADSVVLDLGAGVGYFAVAAALSGARDVIGVELGESVYLARNIVEANGLQDRVRLIRGDSRTLELEEKADIIVSDLRGALPLYGSHLECILDARRRLLRPGGRLIPAEDRLFAGLISDAHLYASLSGVWVRDNAGIDLSEVHAFALNSWMIVNLPADRLVEAPVCWAVLDYHALEATDVAGEASWKITGHRRLHGVLIWFDAMLTEGVEYSNSPCSEPLVYGQGFFPFEEPLDASPGDIVEVSVRARHYAGGYHWDWTTTLSPAGGAASRELRQSTIRSLVAR